MDNSIKGLILLGLTTLSITTFYMWKNQNTKTQFNATSLEKKNDSNTIYRAGTTFKI